MKTKKCTKCGKEKESWEFNLHKGKRDGLESQCRECRKVRDVKDPGQYQLQYKYGITKAHYDLMLKSQNGVCKICKRSETAMFKDKIRLLAVDHCHKTNRIRGLLCQACNHALGGFNDNPEILKAAIKYLEKSK